MGVIKRSSDPIELPEGVGHGTASAWNAGCGCLDCRRWKAEKERDYRARRSNNGGKPLNPAPSGVEKAPSAAGGPMESKIRAQIEDLGVSGQPWADPLIEAALLQARHCDRIPDTGKWHLLGGTVRSLFEIMDRLTAGDPSKSSKPGDEVSSFVASLRGQATQPRTALLDGTES